MALTKAAKYIAAVAEIRAREELSLEEIGRQLRVSWVTVWRWVHGKTLPSPLAEKRIEAFIRRHRVRAS